MGFYTKVTALAKVAQVSTATAAVVGLWYSLEASAGQAPATPKAVAAIAASLILPVASWAVSVCVPAKRSAEGSGKADKLDCTSAGRAHC